MRRLALLLLGAMLFAGPAAMAQQGQKPRELTVGIFTFLSGPASVFGVPGQAAADILIDNINKSGGIGGVPLKAVYVDEAPGADHVVSEFRRLTQSVGVDVMLAAISSGSCMALAPVAEDLKMPTLMWDCGTQRIFEDRKYRYVFRTQAYATPEMLAAVLYLLKTKPDFQSIAVVNQDYAWGRESWEIFRRALLALKPNTKIVAELFPKFGAPDYSTEISRLQALRPDVVLSTSWGGDLDTFVRQAAERRLFERSTFVLPLAESSLERLGATMPEGVIVGARGDHYFLHPEAKNKPELKQFVEQYRAKTGQYPIYPTFHMAQALSALKGSYEKAIQAKGGNGWPAKDDIAEAMTHLHFTGLTKEVVIRDDHQGLETQLIGVTKKTPDFPFAVIDRMILFPPDFISAPVGQQSYEWVQSLKPDILEKVPAPVAYSK
jgi:branched-chain amino acid transport system substrate-binding protein